MKPTQKQQIKQLDEEIASLQKQLEEVTERADALAESNERLRHLTTVQTNENKLLKRFLTLLEVEKGINKEPLF